MRRPRSPILDTMGLMSCMGSSSRGKGSLEKQNDKVMGLTGHGHQRPLPTRGGQLAAASAGA